MSTRSKIFVVALLFAGALTPGWAQDQAATSRHITLQEAVQLALKHNHVVRIAEFQVEEKQHAKDVARSGYFPALRNQSSGVQGDRHAVHPNC